MNQEDALAALVSLPEVQRISVASLKPTDVIVVKVEERITRETVERMRRDLKPIWPDNKIVVLEPGVTISVVDGAAPPDVGSDVPGGGAV